MMVEVIEDDLGPGSSSDILLTTNGIIFTNLERVRV